MRINQKISLAVVLLAILVVTAVGGALVAAQDTTSPAGATIIQSSDDEGEKQTSASTSEAVLTEAEAVTIAEAERDSTATFVELEREGGIVVYSIELDDGSEVEVDATTGDILEIESAGSNDD